jgi:KUP system potassium uptake protein
MGDGERARPVAPTKRCARAKADEEAMTSTDTPDAKPEGTDAPTDSTVGHPHGPVWLLAFGALGVVYGDIGTSPLYALRECFVGPHGMPITPENVIGVLSLIFWSLTTVVSVKYLMFVMRADNEGEGGILALLALVAPPDAPTSRRRGLLVLIGLFGAALLYGDGVITPAISVLSAVEGLEVATTWFSPFVVPIAVAILVGLFAVQRHGTGGLGTIFGPTMLVWFSVIAVLGLTSMLNHRGGLLALLGALNPVHGLQFFFANGVHGFLVLGAVVLVVTGGEALYADMGHFGRRPIRLAWFFLVLPALLMNYFGQGAVLLLSPGVSNHPFYAMVPEWGLVPMVVLATMATIIASQAVISGAFSLTRQAIQLGYLPRLAIVHTSETERGQIYIPQINALLMVTTILLVLGFQSSSRLAAAYGVAVTTTMTVSTVLFFFVALRRWKWSWWAAGIPCLVFLGIDLAFFGANIIKIEHGGWFPLMIGGGAFLFMTTWKKGREVLHAKLSERAPSLREFLAGVTPERPVRVGGTAVFLSGSRRGIPIALVHNLEHNKILHQKVIILTIETEEVPRVPREEKVEIEDLGKGFHRVVARFGFMEDPRAPYALALAAEKGLIFEMEEASFFLGRERLLSARHPDMAAWRNRIFAFMLRNAVSATSFFGLPPEQVVELGTQVEI